MLNSRNDEAMARAGARAAFYAAWETGGALMAGSSVLPPWQAATKSEGWATTLAATRCRMTGALAVPSALLGRQTAQAGSPMPCSLA